MHDRIHHVDVRPATRPWRSATVALLSITLPLAACGVSDDDELSARTTEEAAAAADPSTGDAPAHGSDDADRVVYGWYLGMPIRPNAIVPSAYGGDGPDAPSEDVPDVTVYLVGPVGDGAPVGPSREIPGPDGPAVLPSHQQTHDELVPEEEPHDAIGTFVVPGPAATEGTVLRAEEPEGSIVGAPLATAVRIGGAWAPLSNHLAIEWGLENGLLATVPFEYGGLIWATFVDDLRFDLACQAAPPPPTREAPAPPGPPPAQEGEEGPHADASGPGEEFVVYGWYAGLPIRPTALLPAGYGGPGPEGPAPDVPDLTVYLTAPVDDEAPSAPPRDGIPTPDGPRNLPQHSQTHDRLVRSDEPHDAIGVFVVPGPEASAATVRWDEEPEDSAPGAPLASAIRLGEVWIGLDNHLAIELGVTSGLLDLVPFDYGGLMWHTFDDADLWLTCGP